MPQPSTPRPQARGRSRPTPEASPGSDAHLFHELSIDSYGASARGRGRDANEDQFLIAELGEWLLVRQTSLSRADHARIPGRPRGRLLVVADGLSGNPAGELASAVAVDTLVESVVDVSPWLFALDAGQEDDLAGELASAVGRCQSRVRDAARTREGDAAMGTTLTMAYVLWPRMYVLHIGDSRVYLLREGRLSRMTRDHTVAAQLEQQGVLTPEEAGGSRWRNVLWNAVGAAERHVPDVLRTDLQLGDGLLLCTDGLTDTLDETGIASAMSDAASAEDAARSMVERATTAGAGDDVTAIVTRFA